QVQSTFQKTLPSDPYYKAGVVEFAPILAHSTNSSIVEQLEGIRTIIQDPNAGNLDILVFPEGALSSEGLTYVPDPHEQVIPCEELDYDYSLSEISCYARSIQAYIAVNIHEKVQCLGDYQCPKKGYFEFST
uniref:CN hydrolase domain-containing protein n=1 Tax=Megaselia scalaris TaxID=36166 RepID=T1GX35_MEGSC